MKCILPTYMKLLKGENKTTNDFVLDNIDIPSFKSKIKPQITIRVKNIISTNCNSIKEFL